MASEQYKILSLDGGGSWDIIQAITLKKIYGDIPGPEILKQFNLVIANSGGSLVMAGLIAGLRPSEVVEMIKNDKTRQGIFSKLSIFEGFIFKILNLLFKISPRYSTKRKRIGLENALPNLKSLYMDQISEQIGCPNTDFIVCTFDYEKERAVFMRSNKESKLQTWKIRQQTDPNYPNEFDSVLLLDAIHAASNAPLNYFNKPAEFSYKGKVATHLFWDGAVGANNNPVHVGVIEALCNGIQASEMKILSIGTGSVQLPIKTPNAICLPAEYDWLFTTRKSATFLKDLPKMTSSILADPPDAASFIAYSIINPGLTPQSNNFVRLSPLISPILQKNGNEFKWMLPKGFTTDEFKSLIELDMDAYKPEEVELVEKLCMEWIKGNISNQPVRSTRNFEPVIGYGTFEEGVEVWKRS